MMTSNETNLNNINQYDIKLNDGYSDNNKTTTIITHQDESFLSPLRLMSTTLLTNAFENASNLVMHGSAISGIDAIDDDLIDYNVDNTGGTTTHLMSPDCMNYNGNVSYLNVSCETILNYSVPLYGYCTPFLLLTTVTANTIIVLVLNKRNMATPTNLVLMGKYIFRFN